MEYSVLAYIAYYGIVTMVMLADEFSGSGYQTMTKAYVNEMKTHV